MTTDYRALATTYAQQAGINPTIFVNQIQQESGFNPNARSSAGALGIAQFMPSTAASIGLNPLDPVASLKAAAQYDASNLKTYGGDYPKMLAAYNCGGGCVNDAMQKGGANWLSLTPSETQNYVKIILQGQQTITPTTGATKPTSGTDLNSVAKVWGEYIAVFLIALVLVIVGVLLLGGQQAIGVAKRAAKGLI